MIYQDLWGNGEMINKGKRTCSNRYDIVKGFCNNFNGDFSVLDIGANMCYFGIRLTEDFENSNVMAFEFNSFDMREKHVKQHGSDRLIFLKRKLHLSDIKTMQKYMRFNLILAMSVLHHMTEDVSDWIRELKSMSDYLIVEYAMEDSKRVNYGKLFNDNQIIGSGESHLKKGYRRPIVLY